MTDWAGRRERWRSRWAGRLVLGAASALYGAGVLGRGLLYRLGLFKRHRLPVRIICFGNLTTGGTGKTPAVLLAAQMLRRRNQRVAVLSRGYGRRDRAAKIQVLLDADAVSPAEVGDEPWMLHQALRGLDIPVLISGDRVRAGREALAFYHPDVLLLDDGFQHHALRRDLDVVLVNARDPWGGGRLLPAGDLREPVSAIRRAGLVVLTHVDQVSTGELERLRERVETISPGAKVLESVHKPDFLLDAATLEKRKPSHLAGRKSVSLAGLGDPGQFEETLRAAGAELVQRWRFPDHHRFTLEELRAVENTRSGCPVVTTFKDLARFPAGWTAALPGGVHALGIRLEIVRGRAAWRAALGAGEVET